MAEVSSFIVEFTYVLHVPPCAGFSYLAANAAQLSVYFRLRASYVEYLQTSTSIRTTEYGRLASVRLLL